MIEWLPIAIILLLGVILALSLWLTRPDPRCPECGSKEIQEIGKEPLGLDHASWGGGGQGGGWGSARVYYRISYRCGRCGETWHRRMTETN